MTLESTPTTEVNATGCPCGAQACTKFGCWRQKVQPSIAPAEQPADQVETEATPIEDGACKPWCGDPKCETGCILYEDDQVLTPGELVCPKLELSEGTVCLGGLESRVQPEQLPLPA